MSRFQDVSDRIYIGFDKGDLTAYSDAASQDANCRTESSLYDAINQEFNPALNTTFKQGSKITPTSPFNGPNGLSLQLTDQGNLYLAKYNETTNMNDTVWSGATNIFKLNSDIFSDTNGNITDKSSKNNILNPYCELDTSGNLVCYGCTIASGKPIPYMTFMNTTSPGSYSSGLNLIIDGSYAVPISSTGSGNSISGNLTIISGVNGGNIISSTIENKDYVYLKNLQPIFDKAEECKNASDATVLSTDYFAHLAAEQLNIDSGISHSHQYMNAINLTVGIFLTAGYIYYLSRKK